MFKVLIVEDEVLVRKGIKNTVIELDMGFTGVETAEDGAKAIEIIKSSKPDIILSDVKMPRINGLELAKYVRNHYPEIRMVLISAYDDFNYAQEAINYGVKAYILKPLNQEQLKKTLEGFVLDKKSENMKKDIYSQKQVFFKNMIKGVFPGENYISESIKKLELPITEHWLRAVIFVCDEPNKTGIGFSELICKKLWDEYGVYSVTYYDYIVLFISSAEPLIQNSTADRLGKYMEFYQSMLNEKTGKKISVIAGVGNTYKGLINFNKSYNEALYACSSRYFRKNSKIIYFQDLQIKDYADLEVDAIKKLTEKIIHSVFSNAVPDIEKYTHDFFNMVLLKGTFSIEHIRTKCLDIIFEMGYRLKELEGDESNTKFRKHGYVNEINAISNMEDLAEWFEKSLKSISSGVSEITSEEKFVRQVKEYVMNNYDKKISLSDIADHIYMSSSYLSYSFKKNTGKNLVEYINEVKIEKAKEMLMDTKVRIKDVYHKVGFTDYSYFSRVFKRVTGTSPLNYRYQKLMCGP